VSELTGYYQLDRAHMTGHPEIDAQHREMARLLYELAEAARRKEGPVACLRLFDDYIKYTRFHFAHEEKLMAAGGYPLVPSHHDTHEKLLSQLVAMRSFIMEDDPKLIASDAFEWLVVHIERNDKELAAYLLSTTAH
jgi:hemerythrin-like metal-binding protein